MYYKLKPNYVMRGWKLLPCGLVNTEDNQTAFMTAENYSTLKLAVNGIEEDSILYTQKQREFLKEAEKAGVLEKTKQPSKLSKEQEYFAYPARFIRSAHWSITGRCNYRCRHCYMSAPHAKYSELPHETCMEIIRQLAECGIRRVSITGGEPLVRSDFWEIVDELKRNQILISVIYSNGKLVTREFLEQLEKRGMHPELNMSFDGVGCHDWLRGVPGAEETAIEAFRLCREMGFSTSAEFCLHRGNRDSLRETVKLLGSLGVRGLKVGPVVEVGEWADFGAGMTLTQEEVYDTYLSYLPQFIEDGQPLLLQLSELFCSMPGGYWIPGCKGVSESQVGNYCLCGHARTELYITAEGRWMPCMPMSGKDELAKQFPGIKDTPLKDALNDSFYLSCIAKNLGEYFAHNPECAACPYRLDCASGCRGRAATEDDYMAVDREICIMYKGGYMERVKKLMEELQIPMVYPQ